MSCSCEGRKLPASYRPDLGTVPSRPGKGITVEEAASVRSPTGLLLPPLSPAGSWSSGHDKGWVKIGNPTSLTTLFVPHETANIPTALPGVTLNVACFYAAIHTGYVCGLGFILVADPRKARYRIILQTKHQMDGALGRALIGGDYGKISPVGHNGKPHSWQTAVRLPMHELVGHAIAGMGHTTLAGANMDGNVSVPFTFPHAHLPSRTSYNEGGFRGPEIGRLRSMFGMPFLARLDRNLTPKKYGGTV